MVGVTVAEMWVCDADRSCRTQLLMEQCYPFSHYWPCYEAVPAGLGEAIRGPNMSMLCGSNRGETDISREITPVQSPEQKHEQTDRRRLSSSHTCVR